MCSTNYVVGLPCAYQGRVIKSKKRRKKDLGFGFRSGLGLEVLYLSIYFLFYGVSALCRAPAIS